MFDFKNASPNELSAKYKELAQEIGDDQFFTKKELKYLPEVLMDREQVLSFSSGMVDGNTWLIALTDKRIIFLDKGFIFGLKQHVITLDKVNAISCKTGLLFGEISISTGGIKSKKVKQCDKRTVKHFTNQAQYAIDKINHKNPSKPTISQESKVDEQYEKFDKLRELADLKNEGILTEEEFLKEKNKILETS